ncbi:putative ABC-type xenobiotic transporter [Microsporum audouinii]
MSDIELDQKAKPSGFKSYKRIFNYADRNTWILYSVSFTAAIIAGAALPLMDLIFGKREVAKYSIYLVYLFIAKFFLVYVHTVAASTAAIRATKALRLDFLQSLLRQDTSYFDSKKDGSPSVKVTTNGNIITNGISEKLSVIVQSCATFVVAFAVAFRCNAQEV